MFFPNEYCELLQEVENHKGKKFRGTVNADQEGNVPMDESLSLDEKQALYAEKKADDNAYNEAAAEVNDTLIGMYRP